MKLLLPITLAAVYGTSLRLLFASFGDAMAIMSITFFFLVPFLVGYLTILLLPYKETHTQTGAFFKPAITCLLILLITMFLKIEGQICWLMAFPIFAFIAGCGGLVAFHRKKRRFKKKYNFDFEKNTIDKPDKLTVSLLFFIPIFLGLIEGKRTTSFEYVSIEEQVDIPAPPDAVWDALTSARQTTAGSQQWSLCGMIGFPHHKSTTLDTVATGGHRTASYEKGLTFFETISQLEPGRRLDLNITTHPATISKAVMDEHIVIGGEHIRMQGDTYTLQPLPNGKTRLSLTSRFSINTPFNWYARIWANWLMSDVLTEELQILKQSCTDTTCTN